MVHIADNGRFWNARIYCTEIHLWRFGVVHIIYFVVQLKTLSNMRQAEWENSYINGRDVDRRSLVLFWNSTRVPKRTDENHIDNGAPELKKGTDDTPRAPNWISGLFPKYQTTLWNEWLALDNNNKNVTSQTNPNSITS